MNKSRKGAALIMALVVVLAGGGIIAITFNMVFRHAWFSPAERAVFVDHTTVLDAVQAERAFITQANLTNGVTMSAPGLTVGGNSLQSEWPTPPFNTPPFIAPPNLNVADLIVHSRNIPNVGSGVGRGQMEVTVYDVFFSPAWMSDAALRDPALPSVYNMLPGGTGAFMTRDGWHTAAGSGSADGGIIGSLDVDRYGAYLIRVELFDHRGRLVRRAEESFVQVLP